MRLYEQPCQAVRVGRRRYRLRLTFDRVLYALDAAQDPLLTDADRIRLVLGLLLRDRVPRSIRVQQRLMEAVMAEISAQSKSCDGPPVMSLTQDAPLIRAAFRQAYGIDLDAVDLPWVTFCELLAGLPEGTRFSDVVGIRSRPVPPRDRHNASYVDDLLRAKAAVALKIEPEQRERVYQSGLDKLARHIMAWAEEVTGNE